MEVFAALSHPVRRRVLELLREQPLPAGEIAARFSLSRPSVSEHLAVLREAGLIREDRRGRHRVYHLEAAGLRGAGEWIGGFEGYWSDRLDTLEAALDDVARAEASSGTITATPHTAPAPEPGGNPKKGPPS